MKIETSLVKKLRITELDDLDPITVYLEDFELGRGKITIDCWGKSWTSFWGAMGGQNIAQFFCGCNDSYLINNLDSSIQKLEPDFEMFTKEVRKKICEMRKDNWPSFMDGHLSKELARELYDIEDWSEYVTDNPYEPIRCPSRIDEDEFEKLDFNGFDVPERVTTEYLYLKKIIQTVQNALKQDSIKAA